MPSSGPALEKTRIGLSALDPYRLFFCRSMATSSRPTSAMRRCSSTSPARAFSMVAKSATDESPFALPRRPAALPALRWRDLAVSDLELARLHNQADEVGRLPVRSTALHGADGQGVVLHVALPGQRDQGALLVVGAALGE